MISASVIGATGYVGQELVRLLCGHPGVRIAHIVSQSHSGQPLSAVYGNYTGRDLPLLEEADTATLCRDSDVVFVCLPHGASARWVGELYDGGTLPIDLSADFRYRDAAAYEAAYGPHPRPELLSVSAYGLPELHREEIRSAGIIGNPGCYTTCTILALAPLVSEGLIDPEHIVVDAISGVSGAGRTPGPDLHFCQVYGDMKAYKAVGHRHTSEIEQEISLAAGQDVHLSFTPHLAPVNRGILATIHCELTAGADGAAVAQAYRRYDGEPFVSVLKEGTLPQLCHVVGSNRCHIGFVVDERLGRLVIVSALDNLIKGAAGQAVENMNIRLGLPETQGLDFPAWYL